MELKTGKFLKKKKKKEVFFIKKKQLKRNFAGIVDVDWTFLNDTIVFNSLACFFPVKKYFV